MNAKSIHTRWLAACIVLGMAACSGEDMPPVPGEGEQGAVLVTVNVSTAADTRAGDPGTDHMEDQQRWDNLSLYLVYPDGTVTEHTVTRTKLESENPVSFSTWTGTADLYAIAYAEPQKHKHCTTPQKVYDLQTISINTTAFTDLSSDDQRRYMQNLYSGKHAGINIVTDATEPEKVTVTLTRIISKVDVQYDMADALDGQYTDVKLENMTFYGPDFGYFFPDKASTTATQTEISTGHYVVDGGISAVNGRTYFYTFPYKDGDTRRHKFGFTVDYTKEDNTSQTDYTATFNDALHRNAWYYITLNVRGKDGFAGKDITLTQETN